MNVVMKTVMNQDMCLLEHNGMDTFEPPCEKTGLRGFRLGPTQTGLCSHRRWLEA